jgi:hypothetical protein
MQPSAAHSLYFLLWLLLISSSLELTTGCCTWAWFFLFEKCLLSHITPPIAAHMAGHAAKARTAGIAAVAPVLAVSET